MRKLPLILALLLVSGLIVGCSSGEVGEKDVENWQNQGRDPNDKSGEESPDSR